MKYFWWNSASTKQTKSLSLSILGLHIIYSSHAIIPRREKGAKFYLTCSYTRKMLDFGMETHFRIRSLTFWV
jgi:hypothetical protein